MVQTLVEQHQIGWLFRCEIFKACSYSRYSPLTTLSSSGDQFDEGGIDVDRNDPQTEVGCQLG